MKTQIVNLLIALCLLSSYNSIAQKYDCGTTGANPYTVTAKSGLSMRISPGLISEKVQAVPFGKEVMVCDFYWENGPETEIEGIQGKWVKAFYRGKEGYMFNGFLEKEIPVQLVFPEWGPSDYQCYAGDSWTGVYKTTETDLEQSFDVATCISNRDTLLTPDGDDLPVSYPVYDKPPMFLVSGIENVNMENLYGRAFNSKFLLPGEELTFYGEGTASLLYAKGRLIKNEDKNTLKAYTGIRNYELRMKRMKNGILVDKLVYKTDMVDLYDNISSPFGGMDIRWLGDIDSDGEADLILQKTDDMCTEFMLFLSTKAESNYLLKQVSRYMVCDGC